MWANLPQVGGGGGLTRVLVLFEKGSFVRPRRHRPLSPYWRLVNRLSQWMSGTPYIHVEVYFIDAGLSVTSTAASGVRVFNRLGCDLERWDVFNLWIPHAQAIAALAYARERVGEPYNCVEQAIPYYECFVPPSRPPPSCHGIAFGVLRQAGVQALQAVECPRTPGALSRLISDAPDAQKVELPQK